MLDYAGPQIYPAASMRGYMGRYNLALHVWEPIASFGEIQDCVQLDSGGTLAETRLRLTAPLRGTEIVYIDGPNGPNRFRTGVTYTPGQLRVLFDTVDNAAAVQEPLDGQIVSFLLIDTAE